MVPIKQTVLRNKSDKLYMYHPVSRNDLIAKGEDEMGKTGALPCLALPHKILDPLLQYGLDL